MASRAKPPFRADHVGSLIRPPKLAKLRAAFKRGEISREELKGPQEAAIREVVKLQEDAGLKSITDGEFQRDWFHVDFLREIENITVVPPSMTLRFHTHEHDIDVTAPGLRVDGKLKRTHPIFVDHFKTLKPFVHETPKMTLPSPSTVHFRGGRKAISAEAYPDLAEFYEDLARVYREEIADLGDEGCRYIQLDEVNLAFLCDPKLREQVRNIGENPETLPETYAALINAAIRGRPSDMVVCMHLCRGNFRGAWLAEGGYDPVAEVLFNEVEVDGFFLEYDSPRAGSFEPLRHVPKGKTIVLGLVTTKLGKLETKDELKRRIEEASRYVPLDQLALSPQCGFASAIEQNVVGVQDEIAKLSLVVEVAREVWG